MEANVVNIKKENVGTVQLSDAVFNTEVKEHTVWEVIKWQLASRRAGTASTKTRAEVRGSRRKILPQKGTGNARHGDRKANIFVGGGVVHGPHPRDYYYALPKKVRKKALKGVLSMKLRDGELTVIEDFTFDEPKTKKAIEVLKNFDLDKAKVLLVLAEKDMNVIKSFRNLPKAKVLLVEGLNTYDILNADHVLVTKSAVEKINERLG
ncbi:MAG TPA: 50S ribosomal protein L4 [Persephonella sp.]|uniref:Large ribosomal subunit protein uL4 n=1 Tax=Persephonella marina (strain DSM 14350 / EX-H1) TaxID=123214 RepID=C0QQM4_PERMH|nr:MULTISPECIES: 50S ribosomal protein L4 [Persephonella]ACO03234.1 ribosomal protein, L4/L1 family [Persephonella marina EX-H1]HCB68721.1 50S ribosomal protein L4 [Persephonella sp.]